MRLKLISALGIVILTGILLSACNSGPTEPPQIWQLVNPKGDIAMVSVAPFGSTGKFVETSDSPGWWIYDQTGAKLYRIKVGGTFVHSGSYDKWTFSGMTGSGSGFMITGNGQEMTDAPSPNGTHHQRYRECQYSDTFR
jgi:hypothetical protein